MKVVSYSGSKVDPNITSPLRLTPVILIWILFILYAVLAPMHRAFSLGEWMLAISLVVLYPVIALAIAFGRNRSLHKTAESRTGNSEHGRLWLFSRAAITSSMQGVPGITTERLHSGWIATHGKMIEVHLYDAPPGAAPARFSGVVARVECVSLLPFVFEPVLRMIFDDDTVIEAQLVRAGLQELRGVWRSDIRVFAAQVGS